MPELEAYLDQVGELFQSHGLMDVVSRLNQVPQEVE